MTVGQMEELAQEMGIAPDQISLHYDNYVLNLMQRGVLVDLDIGYFRAKGQLSDADLGIEMSGKEKEFVTLGHQKLLPPEIVKDMERAESRGRYNLEKHTIEMILGRFLPVTASTSFQEANDAQMAALFAVRDRIIDNYDVILEQLKAEFRLRAHSVWDRLEKRPADMSAAAWASGYAKKLISRIPPKNVIEASFYWTTRYSFVPLPSSIQEEALKQQKVRQQSEMLHYETEDRKREIEKMNRLVLETMRKQKEEAMQQTSTFLDQTVFKLREVVLNTCQQAMTTLKKNDGKLMGSTVKQLKNLVDQSRKLNFYNDEEVAKFVDQVDKEVGLATNERSTPKLERIMKEMEIAMTRSLRAVESERTKKEEIARIIGRDVLRSARTVE